MYSYTMGKLAIETKSDFVPGCKRFISPVGYFNMGVCRDSLFEPASSGHSRNCSSFPHLASFFFFFLASRGFHLLTTSNDLNLYVLKHVTVHVLCSL